MKPVVSLDLFSFDLLYDKKETGDQRKKGGVLGESLWSVLISDVVLAITAETACVYPRTLCED